MKMPAAINVSTTTSQAAFHLSQRVRTTLEVVTAILLLFPPVWLAFHWPSIPAVSPHLRHSRLFLWDMPMLATLSYCMLSEPGMLSTMTFLRQGQSLYRLRPLFLTYTLTVRLELLAFFAVLGLLMDRTAETGQTWAAKGFIAGSLTVIFITIFVFIVMVARTAFRPARPHA
jgi:hypothetical protein